MVKRSPFFYVGDKYKIIDKLKAYFPKDIDRFIEPFLGGGTVFMNVSAKEYVLNDIDEKVITLHKWLVENSSNSKKFFEKIKNKILDYELSCSYLEDVVPVDLKKKWKKTYYAKYNKKKYYEMREDYNNFQNDTMLLYLLLIYGFNRMLRFNSSGKFNVPVGNVDFNSNVVDALNNYFSVVRHSKIKFYNKDYTEFLEKMKKFRENDFIYFDPPYLISSSEYNKLWNKEREKEFVSVLDKLDNVGVKFAVSNVTHYRGRTNNIFLNWAKEYNMNEVKSNYISYHNNSQKRIIEVLVTNYD